MNIYLDHVDSWYTVWVKSRHLEKVLLDWYLAISLLDLYLEISLLDLYLVISTFL